MNIFGPVRTTIDVADLDKAMRKAPAAMWRATADGYDRAFRGFWKALKPRMKIRRTGYRFSLTKPQAWPIKISYEPNSETRPDFDRFYARIGTKSEAARRLEFGGTVKAKGKQYLSIPISRNAKGTRIKRNRTTPEKARKAGIKMITMRTKKGNLVIRELVKPKGKRVGRPRKGQRRRKSLVPGPAIFLLVRSAKNEPGQLGFYRVAREIQPKTRDRITQNVGRAVQAVLRGQEVRIQRRPQFAS